MTDLKIVNKENVFDAEINQFNTDLEKDNTLETSAILSLFGCNEDYFVNGYNQEFNGDFEKNTRGINLVSSNIEYIKTITKKNLNWMIEEELAKEITVEVSFDVRKIFLYITIDKNKLDKIEVSV